MKQICEKTQNRLAEDGPGAFRDDETAQEHLADCHDCFAFLESLSLVEDGLRSLPPLDAPDAAVESLLARPEFSAALPGAGPAPVREARGLGERLRDSLGALIRPRVLAWGGGAVAVLLLIVAINNGDEIKQLSDPSEVPDGWRRFSPPEAGQELDEGVASELNSLGDAAQAPEASRENSIAFDKLDAELERLQKSTPRPKPRLKSRKPPVASPETVGKGEIRNEIRVVGIEDVVEPDEPEALFSTNAPKVANLTDLGDRTFSDPYVQDLPVPGRFYQNVLTLAPGVQDTDGDGNPNVHASRSRDFKAVVSGVSNVEPLTGQQMGEIAPNSIEEMQVITDDAGAEFGRAQGGFANVGTVRVVAEGEESESRADANEELRKRNKKKAQKAGSAGDDESPPPSGPLLAGVGAVVAPVLIEESRVTPEYPEMARIAGTAGRTWLELTIDKTGKVEQSRVIKCDAPGMGFEKAATDAIAQWRYKPATVAGKPVKVLFTVLIEFDTGDSGPDSRRDLPPADDAIELAREFLSRRSSLDDLSLQPANGYWANTYLPGDPTVRLLQSRLAGWDRSALQAYLPRTPRLHDASRRIGQPFDTPQSAALAVYLSADRRGLAGEGRVLVQVGLKGTPRHAGRRPSMNLGLVLDLRGTIDAEVAIGIRALLDAFNQAKEPGDRFRLFVAGRPGGQVIKPRGFRHGSLSVTLDGLLDQAATDGGLGIVDAVSAAIRRVASDDDPDSPLGSSAVLLITGRELGGSAAALASVAHQSAVAGVPLTVVGIGAKVLPSEIDLVALAGQGRRLLLDDPSAASALVDRELAAATRAIARAVRLRVRLAPGVELLDVIGSERLDAARSLRVREAEKSIDLRLSKNLGIVADRGEDEDGIQIVIPSFYAGDTHVILLDVVVPGPGPVAEVTVRYKDLVQLGNGVVRASLSLNNGSRPAGPLEYNVLKNLLSLRLADTLGQAGQAVATEDLARANQLLQQFHSLLTGLRFELPGLDNDPDVSRDIAMLDGYRTLLAEGLAGLPEQRNRLADSMRFAALLKVQPRPWEIHS